MIKLHISKIKNKILISEDEFYKIINEVKKNEEVIIENDEFKDLMEASTSSLEFWNNDIDDKVWNNA